MPLLQQLLTRFSGGRSAEQIAGDGRLARVTRKAAPEPHRPMYEARLDAFEEDCAQPLYDRSVYVSSPQDPAEA